MHNRTNMAALGLIRLNQNVISKYVPHRREKIISLFVKTTTLTIRAAGVNSKRQQKICIRIARDLKAPYGVPELITGFIKKIE